MSTSQSRKLDALVALAKDHGAARAERALAAHRAAALMERHGMDYLTVFPMGLPE